MKFLNIFRNRRERSLVDSGFETYYAGLVRQQGDGGPTADEARRDYMAVRQSLERIAMI